MLSYPCILLFPFHISPFCSLERSLSIRNEAFSLKVKSFSQDFTARRAAIFDPMQNLPKEFRLEWILMSTYKNSQLQTQALQARDRANAKLSGFSKHRWEGWKWETLLLAFLLTVRLRDSGCPQVYFGWSVEPQELGIMWLKFFTMQSCTACCEEECTWSTGEDYF